MGPGCRVTRPDQQVLLISFRDTRFTRELSKGKARDRLSGPSRDDDAGHSLRGVATKVGSLVGGRFLICHYYRKYILKARSQTRPGPDMGAQGALGPDRTHHDSMDGSTVHRRDYTLQSRRPSALPPEVHAPIGCPPAIRTNTYRSTIVLVTSCAIRIPRRIPRINPAAAAQLSSPSTRTAPSAWCPRRDGGPQSFVP
jgi:hypothetical protein